MRLRRSLQVAAASATCVSPLAAFAQVTGSVTTAPVAAPAPALAMPLLVALAIALLGVGAYRIRTRSAGAVAGLALAAGVSLLAGLTYGIITGVVIQGADCNAQTTHSYPATGAPLTSLCPNQIRIVAITACVVNTEAPVGPADGSFLCFVGETLSNGQDCLLPGCSAG